MEGVEFDWFSLEHVALVALAVIGATLQNDAIVIALHYASSAAVMCLCNTSELQRPTMLFIRQANCVSQNLSRLYLMLMRSADLVNSIRNRKLQDRKSRCVIKKMDPLV